MTPNRKRKSDRLMNPGATRDQIECDFVMGPLDAEARRMDRKWGIDRLPELVSIDMARKYGRAMAILNAAIDAEDVDACKAAAANCVRGLQAMDAEAEATGQPKADPTIWQFDLDGFTFGIMRDERSWQAAQEANPGLRLFTLREVGNALQAVAGELPAAKAVEEVFGKSKVTAIRPRTQLERELNDVIPF